VLGSPAYMAPEQLRGEGVDPRSDLFSAGVILYTMLTGFRPFQGDSATTICYKVVNRNPIYVSAMDATLPPEIDRLVAKAIAKTPGERFQTGREMADAIREFREQQAGRLNSDFLKEVIEEHNLIPVFRDSSSHGTSGTAMLASASPSRGKSTRTNSLPLRVWKKPSTWVVVAAPLVLVLAGLVILWQRKTTQVPAIILSQTMAAPTLTPVETIVPSVAAAKIPSARLDIQLRHQFSSGKFSLWLDDKLICQRALHSESKRHALLFKSQQAESINLIVPAGEHHVEIRVQSRAVHYDQSKKIIESFDSRNENVLHVYCDHTKNSMELAL
jgi:serine/threonine protein kinase